MMWLSLFLLHSTLWCGLAWLWMRLRPNSSARLREMVWYSAIAAGLMTPTAQSLGSLQSPLWRLPIPALAAASAAGSHNEGVTERREHAFESARDDRHEDGAVANEAAGVDAAGSWFTVAFWIWAVIAGGLLLRYVLRLEGLRRRLQRREPVANRDVALVLDRLSHRAGLPRSPRLTESDCLGSPVALGYGARREICVPIRALHELDEDELSALIGHEVAHHLRRDTIRLGVLNILQAVFFFQPLLRLALREVQFAAEEECDDWAAQQIEDRIAMASCLTEVAGWVAGPDRSLPVPCMGRRRSQLETRVHRLLDEGRLPSSPSRVWQRFSVACFLAIAPWLAPTVSAGDAHSTPAETTHVRSEHGGEHREHGGRPVSEHRWRRSSEHGRRREHRASEHGR